MIRALAFSLLVFTAVGCGGADPCTGSPCPSDSHPTSSEYQACRDRHAKQMNDKCYQQSLNYEICAQQSTVCTDGKTDVSKTLNNLGTACKTAQDSLVCCAIGLTTCK